MSVLKLMVKKLDEQKDKNKELQNKIKMQNKNLSCTWSFGMSKLLTFPQDVFICFVRVKQC